MPILEAPENALVIPFGYQRAGSQAVGPSCDIRHHEPVDAAGNNSVEDWIDRLRADVLGLSVRVLTIHIPDARLDDFDAITDTLTITDTGGLTGSDVRTYAVRTISRTGNIARIVLPGDAEYNQDDHIYNAADTFITQSAGGPMATVAGVVGTGDWLFTDAALSAGPAAYDEFLTLADVPDFVQFRGDWHQSNTYNRGDIVFVRNGFFRCLTDSHRSGQGPYGDQTNWIAVQILQGAWEDSWFQAGMIVTHGGNYWQAISQVNRGDPEPGADDNVKWLRNNNFTPAEIAAMVPGLLAGNVRTFALTSSSDLVPASRIDSAIARVSQIPTVPTVPAASNATPTKVGESGETSGDLVTTAYARANHKHELTAAVKTILARVPTAASAAIAGKAWRANAAGVPGWRDVGGGFSGAWADLTGRPTLQNLDKASNADVDAETDDADYMTVAKVFRAIGRRVKNASTSVRGIVQLARNEDVDSTETDTTRVPDVARVKRMINRLKFDGHWTSLTGTPAFTATSYGNQIQFSLGGSGPTLGAPTSTQAGIMTSSDKVKLDKIKYIQNPQLLPVLQFVRNTGGAQMQSGPDQVLDENVMFGFVQIDAPGQTPIFGPDNEDYVMHWRMLNDLPTAAAGSTTRVGKMVPYTYWPLTADAPVVRYIQLAKTDAGLPLRWVAGDTTAAFRLRVWCWT